MSTPLEEVDDRLAAVLFDARGADGTLGTLAQRESIAARTFRRVYQPLDDPRLDGSLYDRAVWLKWTTSEDRDPGPRNPLDPDAIETHTIELQVGYHHGGALSGLAHVQAGESAAQAVRHSRRRAHDDARAIINALSVGELVSGGLTGVEVLSVMRASHTVDELAEGRVLSRLTLQVTIVVDNA